MSREISVAIDVGGTFTDIFGHSSTGEMSLLKVPTTPDDPSRGVTEGLSQLLADSNLKASSVKRFIHGTTTATNAVIEQKGAITGLITTQGFEDVLVIGRQKRSELYNLFIDPETPGFLVPRRRRLGVPERVTADGSILLQLDEDAVREVARLLCETHRVEAISVCYLFSFLEPSHERRTREIIKETYPEVEVSLSSDIDPTFREYERTLVTTFDAYLRPKVSRYIAALARELDDAGVSAELEIMQSRGGIATAATTVERPVSLLRSGPAAGVIAAQLIGEICGEPNVISNDIGGTTADIGVIAGGKALTSTEGKVLKYPIRIPMIDVSSIGAGGGSIAWLDDAASLHVGPQSAGAAPGPVCYGQGGTQPTLTDASVVLGYLNPEFIAGGNVSLDADAAHVALEKMATELTMSKVEVAAGIHTILNNRMADEIRFLTVTRGYDPRDFSLVVLGGAGPIHGGPLARALGLKKVIVPFAPGVLSAFGLLVSDIEHDNAQSFRHHIDRIKISTLAQAYDELDAMGMSDMQRDGVPAERIEVRRYADMRYVGQSYELEVEVIGTLGEGLLGRLVEDFHTVHERVYRQRNDSAQVEFINLRTVHIAAVPQIRPQPATPGSSWQAAQSASRSVYFSQVGGYTEVPVFEREKLPFAESRNGPFIVEQTDSTTVVFPDETAQVEPHGNLILEMRADD
jgi:N-methylhydantoinase A